MKRKYYKFTPYYLFRHHTWHDNLKSIDLRTALFREEKFVYMRMPKSANTTVLRNISARTSGSGRHRHFSEMGVWDSLSFPKGYFIFTVVRNPYTRMLSSYLNKIADESARHHRKFADNVRPYDDGTISFRGFCRYLADGGEQENGHWMRQTRILRVCDRLDYTGRFESLEADLNEIIRRIWGQNTQPYERGGDQTNASTRLNDFYDAECRQIIEHVYAQDFDDLGYRRDKL